jgi:hypothetical protein
VLAWSATLLTNSSAIRLAGAIRCGSSQRRHASVATLRACRTAPAIGSSSSDTEGRLCRYEPTSAAADATSGKTANRRYGASASIARVGAVGAQSRTGMPGHRAA